MPGKIKRGGIYWVDWSPGRGSEQKGRRPALVIQNDIGNELSPTTIVASCSTAVEKTYPFIVPITTEESGLSRDCSVNLAQIFTVDKSRLSDKCGELDKEKMTKIDEAIKRSLSIG